PVVWSILYILMGVATYMVVSSRAPKTKTDKAIFVYAIQLAVNFFWSIIFFNLNAYLFGFIWLVLLLFLVVYTTKLFYDCDKTAGYLLIPYILWVTFAGYLNFGVFLLNK
ncbi:MAG: tryptophan-rich sensory protein, partial [Oscillospiraceae bacterium]|nr:tryptophan-rich sensory protein [Candidatus Equicaccousia limihippi]